MKVSIPNFDRQFQLRFCQITRARTHLAQMALSLSLVAMWATPRRVSRSPQLRICSVSSCSASTSSAAAMPPKGGSRVTPDCGMDATSSGQALSNSGQRCDSRCATWICAVIRTCKDTQELSRLLPHTMQLCCSRSRPLPAAITSSCCRAAKALPAMKAPS